MANPLVLMTLHPDSAGNLMPLPIREAQVCGTAGHAVCAYDYALLAEMLMDRWGWAVATTFDAYPNGMQLGAFGGWAQPFQAINALEMSKTLRNGVWYADQFVDTAWDMAPEYFANYYDYDLFALGHGVQLSRVNMTNRTPRELDDLRRRYYDVKRCTRYSVPKNAVQLTENLSCGYGWNNVYITPREYTWNDGTCGALSLDSTRLFHQTVMAHQNFRMTPRCILGRYWMMDENNGVDRYRTVWLPISANGTIDTSAISPSGCREVYEQEFGGGPTGDNDSWVGGALWRGHSQEYVVIYDIEFPLDRILVPWQWTPPN